MANFAKRYSQAILESLGREKCEELLSYRSTLQNFFQDQNFLLFLNDPFVGHDKKSAIVLDLLKVQDAKIRRVLSVLGESGRLSQILEVLYEIQQALSLSEAKCSADVFCRDDVSEDLLIALRQELERKTGYKIVINKHFWENEGVKCNIAELGLEVSFSKEKFMQELQFYILDSLMKGVQVED